MYLSTLISKRLQITLIVLSVMSFGLVAQKNLPDLTLKNLEGQSRSVAFDYSQSDTLCVFVFWATWCGPCIQELDALNDVYLDWQKDLKLKIIAVSVDDSKTVQRVKPLVNGKNWDFEVLLDTNQDLKRLLGISNTPYLIVTKNGTVVYSRSGHSPGSEDQLLEKLKGIH